MVNLSSLKNNILLISKKLCAVVLSILLLTGNVMVFAETVDFAPGTPVVQALRALGYKFNRNIIVSGNVAGTVSMHLDDVDFDEALRAMSIAAGFSYVKEGKNIVVGTQETVKQMRTYTIHNVDEEAVAKQLKVFVEDEEDVVVNKELHTVAVLGSNGVLNRIEQEIERIDKPVHQVMIRAAIIELNNTKSKNTGVNWSRKRNDSEDYHGMHPNGNWTDGVGFFERNSFKFQISASLEDTISRGRILARPSIATSDGNKASILMGDKVPVFTSTSTSENADATVNVEYKDVGVSLEVTPRINDVEKGLVTMAVEPSVSVITAWVESGNNKAPQISERSAQTLVRVKSGETILIGGLLRDEEVRTLKRIPLLSKIPILGALFRNRTRENRNTEIVIAITPMIIRDENGRPVVEEQRITAPLKKEVQVFNVEENELNDGNKVKGLDRAAVKRDKVNRTDYHTKPFTPEKMGKITNRKVAEEWDKDEREAEIDRQKIYDEWAEDEKEAEKDRKKIKKERNEDEEKAEEERQKSEKEAAKEEEKAAVQEPPQEVQQPAEEVSEPMQNVQEPPQEVQQPAEEVSEPIQNVQEMPQEVQQPAQEDAAELIQDEHPAQDAQQQDEEIPKQPKTKVTEADIEREIKEEQERLAKERAKAEKIAEQEEKEMKKAAKAQRKEQERAVKAANRDKASKAQEVKGARHRRNSSYDMGLTFAGERIGTN